MMNSALTTAMQHSRRGLTVIEVVIAVATLAIAAGMILGGITFSERVAQRSRDVLAGTEIAHRILIQHIRDRAELRGQPERVDFGGVVYEFDLEERVLAREFTEGGPTKLSSTRSSDVALGDKLNNQLFLVTVNVWHNGEKGPFVKPIATLTRIFNPYLGLEQNADDLLERLKDELSPELDR